MSKPGGGGGKAKRTPNANVDFVQIIPKFLQGKMSATPKPKDLDDTDDDSAPTLVVQEPERPDRPDLEDEAPTIVADDDVMALLAKQELVYSDGQLVRKEASSTTESEPTTADDAVEFGKKKKKAIAEPSQASKDGDKVDKSKESSKKRIAEGEPSGTPSSKKKIAQKTKLSFDDEEDV